MKGLLQVLTLFFALLGRESEPLCGKSLQHERNVMDAPSFFFPAYAV